MIKLSIIFMCLLLSSSVFAKKFIFPFMGRNFTLITPDKTVKEPRPLVVLLHGCKQDAGMIIEGTRFDEAAQDRNFFVLAPEQSIFYNSDHCWNWFLPFQQERNSMNDMATIVDAIESLKALNKIDDQKIFIAGISAGGVMAHTLAVCYPDVFKGVAIHSGLSYKIAENLSEAQTVLTIEDQKSPEYLGKEAYNCGRNFGQERLSQVMIIHGTADPRVNPVHAEIISKVNAVWFDYLDDGRRNSSVKPSTKTEQASFANSYSTTTSTKTFPTHNVVEKKLIVKGLAHAWGGGKPVSANFDPKAPSSTTAILDFFQIKQ
jgi:poly(hydroxyalkanoate) depolymerase family esterase